MIMKAALTLKDEGILATVVSMPSVKIFEEQDEEYKMSIFPHGVPKISLEAGATASWYKYVGRDGIVIGLDRFGASASGEVAQEKLGIWPSHVVEAAKKLVKK
jgi:transketolase